MFEMSPGHLGSWKGNLIIQCHRFNVSHQFGIGLLTHLTRLFTVATRHGHTRFPTKREPRSWKASSSVCHLK